MFQLITEALILAFILPFSYAGTWELVSLFVGTKNCSYHICYESIGRKNNKIPTLKSRDIQTWTDRTEKICWKKNVLNEISK